jgi:hypothetical protein
LVLNQKSEESSCAVIEIDRRRGAEVDKVVATVTVAAVVVVEMVIEM